ncbi:MAG: twin-arginine translocation signal domain-containing protein [Deltaproteobacteria bacterium]|nr:twin-arginine translocation signal domain-containing protein [Deltaproteobacteria bacterium]
MKITRRQFLQYCTASAAALGLSQLDLLKLEKALAANVCGCEDFEVPHVIWMQGQSCGGCTLSILNRMQTDYPPALLSDTSWNWTPTALDGTTASPGAPVQDVVDLLVGDAVGALTGGVRPGWAPFPNGYINLDYQSEVMAAAGDLITDHVECLEDNTPFFLALSGAIPLMDPHYKATQPTVARQPYSVAGSFDTGDGNGKMERSIAEVVEWLATSPNCLGFVCFGTCASFGGIPAAKGTRCASTGGYNFLVNYRGYDGTGGKADLRGKIVNCPGCAPHPDWMIYPLAYYILTSSLPALDTTEVPDRVWLGDNQVFTRYIRKNTPRDIYTGDKGYSTFCEVCPKFHPTNLCTDLGAGPGNGDGTSQKEFCTREQGCNGPYASPDCPTRRWNNFDDHQPNQWCVGSGLGSATPNHSGANYVCQGCAEVDFPDGRSPFFEPDKNNFS